MASDPKFDQGDDVAATTGGLRILIVEDEPVLARNLARTLERMGHAVESVESGEAALGQMKAQRPDLVFLDNRLPGLSGLETLQRLRADDPSLLVVLMTVFATIDDAVTAMRLGAADFVRKPIGLAELELAVERVVQNDRLRWERRYSRGQRDSRTHDGLNGGSEARQHLRCSVESSAHACVTLPPGGIVWADLEKSFIEQALVQSGGNQVRAAKLLGLSRDALRYRMEKHGLGARRNGADEVRSERSSG